MSNWNLPPGVTVAMIDRQAMCCNCGCENCDCWDEIFCIENGCGCDWESIEGWIEEWPEGAI